MRRYIAGLEKADFVTDSLKADAVTMRVFALAEAVGQLADATRTSLGNLPWNDIRAVRNRIAHGYFTIDFGKLWEIAASEVPLIETAVRAALAGDPDLPPEA